MAHDLEDEIKCPYCDYVFSDSWELNDSDGSEIDCGDCGREFTLNVNVEVSYSTNRIDCDELSTPEEHEWKEPSYREIDQDTCDRWNSEMFCGKSDHVPHGYWHRECKNCEYTETEFVESDAECPFN